MNSSDIKFFKSAADGTFTYTEITTSTKNNIFSDILTEALTEGVNDDIKKFFIANINTANETFTFVKNYLLSQTTGEDWVSMIKPPFLNAVAADLEEPLKYCGIGTLSAVINAGESVIYVLPENSNAFTIENNDKLFLINGVLDYSNPLAKFEFVEVDSFVENLGVYEITIKQSLINSYTEGTCSIVIEQEDLQTELQNFATTSTTLSYDDINYPIFLQNWGCYSDTWTILWVNATEFQCTGLKKGVVGSGTISENFAPLNAQTSTPFFTIFASGWQGTPTIGDTFTFYTKPAYVDIFLKRSVLNTVSTQALNGFYVEVWGS